MNVTFNDLKKDLKESPIFNLSLASKELFHSNFLAWLWEAPETKKGFERLLKELFIDDDMGGISSVIREKKNIDLTVNFDSGRKLLIEVKVKSIPDKKQLEKYEKRHKVKPVLLTLYDPGLEYEDYKIVLFSDLAESLNRHFSNLDGYYGMLIKDYAQYIANFSYLSSEIFKHVREDNFLFFNDDKNLKSLVEDLRISDLVYKGMFDILRRKLGSNIYGYRIDEKKLTFNFQGFKKAKSEMYRATGLVTGYYVVGEDISEDLPIHLCGGVEVQHNIFKLFVMTRAKQNEDGVESFTNLEKLTESLVELLDQMGWFDFEIVEDLVNMEKIKRERKPIGTYQKGSVWCFKYKKRRLLGKTSIDDLAAAIDTYVESFMALEAQLGAAVGDLLKKIQ